MRALTWIVGILATLYCGYWFVGAEAARRAADRAVAEAPARGVEIAHQGIAVAGFPNRFDLTVTEPRVALPARGITWQGPFAQVFSLSYSPWKLIAALPNDQQIGLPDQTLGLTSTRMQASLFMKPRPSLPLDDFKAVVEGASLRSDAGWSLGFGSANLSLVAGEGGQVQAAARVLDLVPDQSLTAALQGAGLPPAIERLDLLADVTLDRPLLLRGAPSEVQGLTLREAHFTWGAVKITGSGEVRADAQGQAEGTLTFRVAGWQQAFAAAEAAGIVPPRYATALRSVLEQMAARSGEPDSIDLPLVMADGRMMLGPVPLGAAPLLR